ncbi:VOC family protein [Sporosarcina sp. D27]|uniref:VOC family protein n=1 Tax=Sporosarcina sp. D27 TaxID=1382305 RepID=UPI00046ECAD3|nr:VOC family protein [Sporosarcina sp. D27]
MKINRIDHVGIMVKDLTAMKAFFLDFGLEMVGETEVKGEWLERMIRLHDVKEECVKLEIVMFRPLGGEATIELVKFHTVADENDITLPEENSFGTQHIAFSVEDLEALVTKLKKNGAGLIDEIQNFENTYKLCFVRGPEGIILELAEEIQKI